MQAYAEAYLQQLGEYVDITGDFGCLPPGSSSKKPQSDNSKMAKFENRNDHSIKLYPNPARQYVTVEIHAKPEVSQYRMMDLMGRTMQTGEIRNGIGAIDLKPLVPGLYLIQFTENGRSISTERLIISH